jgi:hypothetical protein
VCPRMEVLEKNGDLDMPTIGLPGPMASSTQGQICKPSVSKEGPAGRAGLVYKALLARFGSKGLFEMSSRTT